MKRVWVLGGTTEGRQLLSSGLPIIYTTATSYGGILAGRRPGLEVCTGPLDQGAMEGLLAMKNIVCILDATHPYALEVSSNAQRAAQRAGIPYRRLLREPSKVEGAIQLADCGEAATYLTLRKGKALITTGSKELAAFTRIPHYQERLYVRVLPTAEVLQACQALGYLPAKIIAMQGPFSLQMNVALLLQTGARFLVTKDGGRAGGFAEKMAAAQKLGVAVILIKRPLEEGCSLEEAIAFAQGILKEVD